ncbi:LOW QUALITY PROTEIN: uncharacterized protein LOC129536014 [Moschus berezovskii]|uniref:LOW QUALITY PROTEIN: uncharacterized protein LOC129536014 n=1 Tax=Moschus berezovskii TaxID=68408 RepID=UPI002443840E|nr:LOW QUALITY PROTEIN: uncharacterized protein LOC129536014 [Moschus berezovskii]
MVKTLPPPSCYVSNLTHKQNRKRMNHFTSDNNTTRIPRLMVMLTNPGASKTLAYRSSLIDPDTRLIGNMALLPIRSQFKGPAPRETKDTDIVDEATYYFKANVFFKNYEIKNEAYRALIYITLYISECQKKPQKCNSKSQGKREIYTLGITNFPISREPGFPLNAIYAKPANKQEDEVMRAYLQQLRQEAGLRLFEKAFDPQNDKPNKRWTCFVKRQFMNKSLSGVQERQPWTDTVSTAMGSIYSKINLKMHRLTSPPATHANIRIFQEDVTVSQRVVEGIEREDPTALENPSCAQANFIPQIARAQLSPPAAPSRSSQPGLPAPSAAGIRHPPASLSQPTRGRVGARGPDPAAGAAFRVFARAGRAAEGGARGGAERAGEPGALRLQPRERRLPRPPRQTARSGACPPRAASADLGEGRRGRNGHVPGSGWFRRCPRSPVADTAELGSADPPQSRRPSSRVPLPLWGWLLILRKHEDCSIKENLKKHCTAVWISPKKKRRKDYLTLYSTLHIRRLLPSLLRIMKWIFEFYLQVFALLWFFLVCFVSAFSTGSTLHLECTSLL